MAKVCLGNAKGLTEVSPQLQLVVQAFRLPENPSDVPECRTVI